MATWGIAQCPTMVQTSSIVPERDNAGKPLCTDSFDSVRVLLNSAVVAS